MIKQFFKILQIIVIVVVISVFGYSIYQKIQGKLLAMNAKIDEANNLLERAKNIKSCNWLVMLNEVT